MNERPTPETDALREAIDNGAAVEAEMTSFAMKLERERDEAREALMKIEEIFIDGGDTYLDFVRVGNIATDYLEGL